MHRYMTRPIEIHQLLPYKPAVESGTPIISSSTTVAIESTGLNV